MEESFLKSLFNTRFETLITPRIIRVLYILVIIAIAIGALAFTVSAFAADSGFGILTLLVLAPLGFLLYVIIARVYLELVIVIFRINEAAQTLAGGAGGAGSTTPTPPSTPPSAGTAPQPPEGS